MKIMLFFTIIAVVFVNATSKRKRKIEESPTFPTEVKKQPLPRLKSKSDEDVDKYISVEDLNNENSPKNLGHPVGELNNENNENRLLLPNPVFENVLEGLLPREIVILAQTCRKILLKIISMDLYQYLRVEGLDIPQNTSEELKKRKIRHYPNWNIIIFKPNISLPKAQTLKGEYILAVVNAKFLKYFIFPKDKHKHDLEKDEIFLCQLNEGISHIFLGKVFSKSLMSTDGADLTFGFVVLRGMPIQVSDDRDKQVVFFLSNGKEGTYELGALNANFNPQLRDISSFDFQPNPPSFEFILWGFNNDKVKNMLAQNLKKDQN